MVQDEARKAKQEKTKIEALHKFIDAPLTRAVMSSIPGEGGESITLLLSAAFDAGFECGRGSMASEVADMLLESFKQVGKDGRPHGAG